mmetsp:Transcript_19527/g.63637  ORF Transcript_19527/g.63637 Transcript_19527/m.63637 type:complete len:488 (-) Transcript_19527:1768-3231(-)
MNSPSEGRTLAEPGCLDPEHGAIGRGVEHNGVRVVASRDAGPVRSHRDSPDLAPVLSTPGRLQQGPAHKVVAATQRVVAADGEHGTVAVDAHCARRRAALANGAGRAAADVVEPQRRVEAPKGQNLVVATERDRTDPVVRMRLVAECGRGHVAELDLLGRAAEEHRLTRARQGHAVERLARVAPEDDAAAVEVVDDNELTRACRDAPRGARQRDAVDRVVEAHGPDSRRVARRARRSRCGGLDDLAWRTIGRGLQPARDVVAPDLGPAGLAAEGDVLVRLDGPRAAAKSNPDGHAVPLAERPLGVRVCVTLHADRPVPLPAPRREAFNPGHRCRAERLGLGWLAAAAILRQRIVAASHTCGSEAARCPDLVARSAAHVDVAALGVREDVAPVHVGDDGAAVELDGVCAAVAAHRVAEAPEVARTRPRGPEEPDTFAQRKAPGDVGWMAHEDGGEAQEHDGAVGDADRVAREAPQRVVDLDVADTSNH